MLQRKQSGLLRRFARNDEAIDNNDDSLLPFINASLIIEA
jgi:hypothetical protein